MSQKIIIAILFFWFAHANALDINQAKESDLDDLLGLGPAMTTRMLKERNTKAAEALGIKSIVFQDFNQFKKDLIKILNK